MRNQGIGSWIHRRREKSAANIAVVSGDQSVTYAELDRRINAFAAALAQRGIRSGDRVAYLGENHTAFLETFFACGVLGAIFVPLNTRLAPPEVRYALRDSGSSILVHADSLEPLAAAGSVDTFIDRRIIVNDRTEVEWTTPIGAVPLSDRILIESHETVIAEHLGSAAHIDAEVSLDDPAMILYTSGTTGSPKGALLTHENLTWNSYNVLVDYDVVSSDIALIISPMFHVASLDMGVLPVILKGGTVVLEPRFDPGRALELIELHRATMISGVPTTYQLICEHPLWDQTDISSLKKLTCGGSAVPVRVLNAYEDRGLAFSGGYGMTETAPGATSLNPSKSRAKMGSAGLPHFFTDLRIVDTNGRVLPAGEVGEIQLSGRNVIREYWNKPEATETAFADGEWFMSGDTGYVDDDGYLFVTGRIKDMIVSGGENVYPVEIEQLIVELPAVDSVAVIGIPDERWGEVPHAVVTLRSGSTLDAAAVQAHLSGRIARYKIPKTLQVVAEMPRTASGKIRKTDLR
ncbi:acyl-CoA synthetase [Lysinibacter cavernae]|uniref:Fatty-acyl-CoA synthase n=1 Tax=Lysinibacter cavernae TaxID=1640652 RepID=A0A7X5R093_9MICO|nr:long-chain fatty acid--CoA ligase [Lysinibacter cavernae]NIH53236.1 fatty-acyl-CoA synthase [Lysinibacter cavernae]